MTVDEGISLLIPSLVRTDPRQYRFGCQNGIVLVRFRNNPKVKRFSAADHVTFGLDDRGIAVKDLKSGVVRELLLWQEIESLAAGEPETSNGMLFQG